MAAPRSFPMWAASGLLKGISFSAFGKNRQLLIMMRPVQEALPLLTALTRTASQVFSQSQRCYHASEKNFNLMDFFDDPNNWGAQEVRTGRSWKKEELRIKSNSDLHKLWYVLYKEYNMLLTMEHAYKKRMEYFPNPERIDKVEESMGNLEEVVRERNRAYYMLETGETGERPHGKAMNPFGLDYEYKMSEHVIPEIMNTSYRENYPKGKMVHYNVEFRNLLREKRFNQAQGRRKRAESKVKELLLRFPNVDMEALQEKYPDVDIERVKREIA